VLRFLRDDGSCQFVCLLDIAGVDYPEREQRFEVVYHLLSPTQNLRVRVKIAAGEDTQVPSAVGLFPSANWYEREAFDLYGILFSGHPDLRRILTDYGLRRPPDCARTSRSPAMSRCATTTRRSAWSMSRSSCRRSSATSTSSARMGRHGIRAAGG
jgi:hypothetical protein